MSEDQFTKLFKYMEKRFDEVDRRLEDTNKKINKKINYVGAPWPNYPPRFATTITNQFC